MCFGGGDDSGSKAMIDQQKQEAEAARVKEVERQNRITSGLQRIREAFEGAPVMKNVASSYDWSKFAPAAASGKGLVNSAAKGNVTAGTAGSPVSGLPAGYTTVQVADPNYRPAAATTTVRRGGTTQPGFGPNGQPLAAGGADPYANRSGGGRTGSEYVSTAAPAGGGGSHMVSAIRGPDGKIYYQGQPIPTVVQQDTGKRTGGINDDFYNKFKQGMLDYYMPQVADQYGDARNELTYRLARAGQTRSSTAADETAKLIKQNAIQTGVVKSKADQGAADLRTRVANERTKAESQLYATENPDVAANTALASIRNISAETPDLTPLGQVFNIAAIGGANAAKGFMNQRLGQSYVPGWSTTGRNQKTVTTA